MYPRILCGSLNTLSYTAERKKTKKFLSPAVAGDLPKGKPLYNNSFTDSSACDAMT